MTDFDEDFVPKSTEYFLPRESQEQVNERKTEEAKVFSALPVIEDILKRFDKQIKFYSSVDAIKVDIDISPEEFVQAYSACKKVRDYLIAEKEFIQSLLPDK